MNQFIEDDLPQSAEPFPKLGGWLCLDFVNTKAERLFITQEELLHGYGSLVAWGRDMEVLTQEQEQSLLSEANSSPKEAALSFTRAITFRETLHRVFCSIAHSIPPELQDMDEIRLMYVEALVHSRLFSTANDFVLTLDPTDMHLDWILWQLAWSAIDLINAKEYRRVKECPGLGDCGFLFLDTSKNGTRRWCSMEGCGSRAKMRRLYARKRSERKQSSL